MNSDQPDQGFPIIDWEPAQLPNDVVARESSNGGQNSKNDNEGTIICNIIFLPPPPGTSFIAPLTPSSPSSSTSAVPTTFRIRPSPSSKSCHVPLTPPATPPAQVDSTSISSTTNRKRKYSNEKNSPPSSSRRTFKHQVNLDDASTENLTEEERKSIKKSKTCKEQRDKKAAYLAQLVKDNERLRQENAIIPELMTEIKSLKAELQHYQDLAAEFSNLKEQSEGMSEPFAQLMDQVGGQTDPIFPDPDDPWDDISLPDFFEDLH